MYKFIGTRRSKNLIAYFNKHSQRWVHEDYLFSVTLKGTEAEFFEQFYRDAETGIVATDWGIERKKSNKDDIVNRGDRIPMDFANTDSVAEAPSRGYEAAIISKIDQERGRYEQDDIRPGLFRDSDGRYQCAKFIPEMRSSLRASYDKLDDAITWMDFMDRKYNEEAR